MRVSVCFYCSFFVFFFKQKTAYEMRISDWSSDVSSSDLGAWVSQRHERRDQTTPECATAGRDESGDENVADHTRTCVRLSILLEADTQRISLEIGRASCRERVCQYV